MKRYSLYLAFFTFATKTIMPVKQVIIMLGNNLMNTTYDDLVKQTCQQHGTLQGITYITQTSKLDKVSR